MTPTQEPAGENNKPHFDVSLVLLQENPLKVYKRHTSSLTRTGPHRYPSFHPDRQNTRRLVIKELEECCVSQNHRHKPKQHGCGGNTAAVGEEEDEWCLNWGPKQLLSGNQKSVSEKMWLKGWCVTWLHSKFNTKSHKTNCNCVKTVKSSFL